jgi:hypothetical protein
MSKPRKKPGHLHPERSGKLKTCPRRQCIRKINPRYIRSVLRTVETYLKSVDTGVQAVNKAAFILFAVVDTRCSDAQGTKVTGCRKD